MELTTLLLLCQLVMLPQSFGEELLNQKKLNHNLKFNFTKTHNKNPSKNTKILLNTNGLNTYNNFQAVLTDQSCRKCNSCMKRALQAFKTQFNIINDVLDEQVYYKRNKRAVNVAEIAHQMGTKTNNNKVKKNKTHKSVTVTKYNLEGEIYALKVKETITPLTTENNEKSAPVTTCRVYQVMKSFPCNSTEGDLILTVARRKVSKRSKKDKNKSTATTETVTTTAQLYKKRHIIDNSQVTENFMPSIEELY